MLGVDVPGPDAFRVRGVLDLNEAALRVFNSNPDKPVGQTFKRASLGTLCHDLLGRTLEKPPDVRCGNWETCPLSDEQLTYAATDAWAGLRCYAALRARAPQVIADFAKSVVTGVDPPPPSV